MQIRLRFYLKGVLCAVAATVRFFLAQFLLHAKRVAK